MTPPQRNTLLAVGIVCGLLALPTTWLTIDGGEISFEGPGGNSLELDFGLPGMNLAVTGLNGFVDLPVRTPLWLIISVAIGAGVLQLLRGTGQFALPPALLWITAGFVALWVLAVLIMALSNGKASLGIGALLGLASAVIPLVSLCVATAGAKETGAASETAPIAPAE